MRTPTRFCVLFLVFFSMNFARAATITLAPNDAHFSYMGRVALDETAASMGFPGIALSFVYTGAAPTLLFDASGPDNYFNLSCNGWAPVVIRLKAGENRIALPTGRAPASGWKIELTRRTESWMGTCKFRGLEFTDGGGLLPAPDLPARKILVIGDSITCGEYLECFPPENEHSQRSTNAARSYGMLLGRWLNAQVHLVGYGGQGIIRDWSGKEGTPLLPLIFERALPDDPASVWDHTRFSPDLILVNDGTDYDAGVPDADKLYAAFDAFVARLRAVHPKAFILLCESSFHADEIAGQPPGSRALYGRLLDRIVRHRQELGDKRVSIARAHYYPGTPADGHLVAFQHEQLALELMESIRPAMGW